MTVAFSSDDRSYNGFAAGFGSAPEVLLHSPAAVDFSPFIDAGSVLLNHDPAGILARPMRCWLDEARKCCFAEIKFGRTRLARRVFGQVCDRILRGVSIGYQAVSRVLLGPGEESYGYRGRLILVTRWRVREISLCAIGIDRTAGLGIPDKRKARLEEARVEELKGLARHWPLRVSGEMLPRWIAEGTTRSQAIEEIWSAQAIERNSDTDFCI
jgi:hypothetical protein